MIKDSLFGGWIRVTQLREMAYLMYKQVTERWLTWCINRLLRWCASRLANVNLIWANRFRWSATAAILSKAATANYFKHQWCFLNFCYQHIRFAFIRVISVSSRHSSHTFHKCTQCSAMARATGERRHGRLIAIPLSWNNSEQLVLTPGAIFQVDQRGSTYPQGRQTCYESGRGQLSTQSRLWPLSWHDIFQSCQELEELSTSFFWRRHLTEVETSILGN